MDVEHNEIFGRLGPNGAGKTTAMNVMTADFVPTYISYNIYSCTKKENI